MTGGARRSAARLRVGLFSAAHVHFETYAALLAARPDVELVGLTDSDAARGQAAAQRLHLPWVAPPETLVGRSEAAVVTAENVHHRRYVELAGRAGLAVLCEKPLATTLADADAMLEATASGGGHLYAALPVRGLPAVGRLRQLVQSGQLGRILAMAGSNHGQLPPGWFLDPGLSGGGAVMDHVSHVADVMRWVLADEVERVYALASNRIHGTPVEDAALVQFTFRGGTVATLDPSWSRPRGFPTWGDVRLDVVGTAGVAALDPWAEQLDWFRSRPAVHRMAPYGPDMDALLIDRFVVAAAGGPVAPELATGQDGRAATAVTLAAYDSIRLERPVDVTVV